MIRGLLTPTLHTGDPVARVAPTVLPVLRATLSDPERVRERARELGVVRRQGKVDAYALVAVVVLGVATRGATVIAQLGHTLAEATGVRLARSSFWDRFTPAFSALLKSLLDDHVQAARARVGQPTGPLRGFTDVLSVDATVVHLHDGLAGWWRGTRRNSAKAALKVHAWVRAFTGELVKYRVTADAHADCRAFGVDHALRGALVIFDRGYSSPSLWRRIENVGGYFLTRLPADRTPLVVSENRLHRGRARRPVGRPLLELLPGLQRALLDVDCLFRCRVRRYATARNRWVEERFRVVAVRDRKSGAYVVFVTNAPPELLPAELVANTYRLRWEAETFFRSAKSGVGLDELPSRKPHVVEALVYAALLRASSAMQALAAFRAEVAHVRGLLVNPGQWIKHWNRQVDELLTLLVRSALREHRHRVLLLDGERARMLADPHRTRITNRGAMLALGYAW